MQSLDENQQKSWHKIITWFEKKHAIEVSWNSISKTNPKFALWFSVLMFVSLSMTKELELKGFTEIEKLAIKTTNDLLGKRV